MGKRSRNTAKTGDQGIYKQRQQGRQEEAAAAAQNQSKRRNDDEDDDGDPMYNEVDRFHNERDKNYLKFKDGDGDGSDSDDENQHDVYQQDAVMDLGLGGRAGDGSDDASSSSSEEEDSGSDEDVENALKSKKTDDTSSSSSEDDSSSDDDKDDEEEEEEEHDVRDWGKRKAAYYHGDTADLEIGQEKEDAVVEEEAAKEVQAARYKHMSEEDFNLSDTEEEQEEEENVATKKHKQQQQQAKKSKDKKRSTAVALGTGSTKESDTTTSGSIGRLSKLSLKQQRKLLDRQHPELLPILSHFSGVVQNFHERTNVATRALLESSSSSSSDNNKGRAPSPQSTAEAVGATKLGQQYLLSKALLESSTALNLAMYLLLKSEQQPDDNDAQDEDGNDNSDLQAVTTVSASASSIMMQSHPIMDRLQKLNSLASKLEEQVEDKVPGLQNQIDNLVKASQFMAMGGDLDDSADDDSASSASERKDDNMQQEEDSDIDHDEIDHDEKDKRDVANKKDHDDSEDSSSSDEEEEDEEAKRAIAAQNAINEARFSLRLGEVSGAASRMRSLPKARAMQPGDDDEDDDEDGAVVGQHLAATLNAIEQRRSTATNRQKRRAEAMAEHLDDPNQDDYLKDGDRGDDHDDGGNNDLQRGLEMMEADLAAKGADEDDEYGDSAMEQDAGTGGDDFYAQVARKTKARKEFKRGLYAVAPKYPRLEPEGEDGEQRAISRTILKNRGLVAHKPKINRNPRVKKRKQFDRALVRRRGAIRDVRAPQEGHQYGGEQTGVKTNISRSRKL